MADVPPIMLEVQANVKNLEVGIKTAIEKLTSLEAHTNSAGNATKELSAKTIAAGTVMGQTFMQLGEKALSFAKDTLTAFTTVGNETRSMQRVLGGSAEEMSRLRFVAEEVGVSSDTLVRGFRILSGHLAKNDTQAKSLGISYRDVNGAILPTSQLLMNLSDRFAAMPPGLERTALAVKAFGRGATEMLPLLSLGSARIAELSATADKLGLTLSGADLAAVKEYSLKQKELHAAIQGVQLTIGRELMPQMTELVKYTTDTIIPRIKDFVDGLTGKGGLSDSLSGSALAAYNWGQSIRGIIGYVISFHRELEITAAVMVTMWAVNKVAAAINTIIVLYKGLVVALNLVKAAAITTGIAEAFAANPLLGVGAAALIGGIMYEAQKYIDSHQSALPNGVYVAAQGGPEAVYHTAPEALPLDSQPPKTTTSTTKTKKLTAKQRAAALLAQYAAEIKALSGQRGTIDAQFALAESSATTSQDKLSAALPFLEQAKALVAAAQAEEKKTLKTKAHAAAVVALNAAIAEQAKIQKEVTNQLANIADETAKAAAAQAKLNEEIAKANSSFTAANSWLASQTRQAGPQSSNFGGFIEVPVVIDGQVVFRATQRYSLLNNRRNVANGLATSNSLI